MLTLPDELHKRLADEARYAADRMVAVADPQSKLYYFSVFFGEATRILNWHWDRDLALIWLVTQNVQQVISARFRSMGQGEPVVNLNSQFFAALTLIAIQLADYIEHKGTDTELTQIMGRLSELAYVTTGNGYYLLQKGTIGISPT